MTRGDAVISDDGVYRYMLRRTWGGDGTVLFVMLNPSTADATQDDATIRRCCGFARSWGYGGILVGNLYGYRATQPRKLAVARDPVGPENDEWLRRMRERAALTVVAWGVRPARDRARVLTVGLLLGDPLYCFGWTRGGHPKHPVRLSSGLPPVPYRLARQ